MSNNVHQTDITFWSERCRDHCMILFILIDNTQTDDLKQQCYQSFQNWNTYLKHQKSTTLSDLVFNLWQLKHDVLQEAQIHDINLVLDPTDFISLIVHMIEELDYFVKLLMHELTLETEFLFWKQEDIEHTTLAGHLIPLLDLGAKKTHKLQADGKKLIQRMKKAHDPHTFLPLYKLSGKAAKDLDQLIPKTPFDPMSEPMVMRLNDDIENDDPAAIDELIHLMIEHEIKEGTHGQYRLKNM